MQDRKLKISANSETQINGDCARVIVREATGKIRIETDKNAKVELEQGDNMRFEKVASFMRVTDLSGSENTIRLTMISGDDGDLTSASGSVTIANTEEVASGAQDCEINEYTTDSTGVLVLAANPNRRSAIVSTSGSVLMSKVQDGTGISIDGVLEFPCQTELWAAGEGVTVQVLEFIN